MEITLGFCHPVRVASMRVVLSRQNQFAQSRTTAATHSALATCLEMETVFGARGRSAPAGSTVEKEGKEEEIMTRQLASVFWERERDALSLVVALMALQQSHFQRMPACSEQSLAMSPMGMSFAPCPCDRALRRRGCRLPTDGETQHACTMHPTE